ncbi:MAG: SDR family NAD(P)-dependent oxidoreductase, partial [Candidatus Kariarchaeaceae archaeon]
MNLSGKTAIITGGALGIGQAISKRLSEAGASVMIVDIDLDAAEATANSINANGGKAKALRADASNPDEADNVVSTATEMFGSVDILVNNAGIYPMMPVMDITPEFWDKTLNLNLKGVFFFAQAAAKQMTSNGKGGKIINIASIDAFMPNGNL